MNNKMNLVNVNSLLIPDKSGYFHCYKDYWWVINANNEVMVYNGRSPICNANETIVKQMRDRNYPDCDVIQVPFVFLPFNPNDF